MIDPMEKAAECELALRTCADDPDWVTLLRNLRDLWVMLAMAKARGLPDWQAQAENAARIQAEILTPRPH